MKTIKGPALFFDLAKTAGSKDYCDECKGQAATWTMPQTAKC